MECLINMSASNDCTTYYNYTNTWIQLVNRGGLFEINNECYLFFKTIEKHIQATLPGHLSGEVAKQKYLLQLLNEEDIQRLWTKLNTDIEDSDGSDELLTLILEKWVTTRGFAQVSSWISDYKSATAEKLKKKRSLRKDLAKKSEAQGKKTKLNDDKEEGNM